jgi:hypothetical protein
MSEIELFTEFAYGLVDYIARHNNNYAQIQSTLNQILGQLTGQSGGLAVPYGLQEIFDRRGEIGSGAYLFSNGILSGPDYNFTVGPGAYWSGSTFYRKTTNTTLSLAGKATGTYYLNLDAGGTPLVSSSADATTVRQFSWNSGTHAISNMALYAGVAVLFDGDDYADMLTSAARSKTFAQVADRLEEMEVLLGKGVQEPASADVININCAQGGYIRILLDRPLTTINLSGAYDGQTVKFELIQDSEGGRQLAFGAEVIGGSDYTLPLPLTAAGNKFDLVGLIYSAGSSKFAIASLARGYNV